MTVACPACAGGSGWDLDWRPRRGFYGDDQSQLLIVCRGCGFEESTTAATHVLSRTGALAKRRR